MTVRGVHDKQVGARGDKRSSLAHDIAVDADGRRDAQRAGRVDIRGVDRVAQGADPIEDPGEPTVGFDEHREAEVQIAECVEDLTGRGVDGQRHDVGVGDVTHSREPVDVATALLGDDPHRAAVLDHDGHPV